ncbi:hypothetical protein GRI91_07705 [Altererythrobacter endophyticus]|uniref:Uncharacterized protein n=2 Tax=Altericroceibacterium endophyticum TaxID=1808508 RepID=A0A6I4T460_9SPHN|nr:hypothetical protein [Altericroceibacterium endophyticum]MXO65636.1 hypothetical protein [Altericroceibacterium endophyticum]
MVPPSPLENTHISAHAWARYKRLMKFMVGVTVLTVIIALSAIYAKTGMVSIHFFIATGLGIFAAMVLMSALMGLVFLSSGTGHDEAIHDPAEDKYPASDDQSAG